MRKTIYVLLISLLILAISAGCSKAEKVHLDYQYGEQVVKILDITTDEIYEKGGLQDRIIVLNGNNKYSYVVAYWPCDEPECLKVSVHIMEAVDAGKLSGLSSFEETFALSDGEHKRVENRLAKNDFYIGFSKDGKYVRNNVEYSGDAVNSEGLWIYVAEPNEVVSIDGEVDLF